MEKLKFNVYGMSCSACAARVDKVVRELDGIKDVAVNLLTNQMVVDFDEPATVEKIERAVSGAGYKAALFNDKSQKKEKVNPLIRSIIRLAVSAVLLIPLMYVSMGGVMFGWDMERQPDGYRDIRTCVLFRHTCHQRKVFRERHKGDFPPRAEYGYSCVDGQRHFFRIQRRAYDPRRSKYFISSSSSAHVVL